MASSLQLHVRLRYDKQPGDHPRIRALLDQGYLISQLQRITDQEAVVTLDAPETSPPPPRPA